jgi:drug/metabolite transporter (DMT)-like permease
MKKETLGTILAIMAALISGVSIVVNKIFIVSAEPLVFTAVRAAIIALGFLVVLSLQKKKPDKLAKGNKKPIEQANKRQWKYLLLIGIIGGGLAFFLFFSGLKMTTAGRAAFLQKTLPIYVTILAFAFLKEKVTKKQVLALVVMLVGLSAISLAEISATVTMGDLLVLSATVLWAVEVIMAKHILSKGESSSMVSFARMFFGALLLFALIFALGKVDALAALNSQQITNMLVSTAILFAYVACWYYSIRYINVSKASTLLLIAPVISLFIGMFILAEPAPLLQLAGSALILIGAYFVVKSRSELATGV